MGRWPVLQSRLQFWAWRLVKRMALAGLFIWIIITGIFRGIYEHYSESRRRRTQQR